jgi:hypothetical protein
VKELAEQIQVPAGILQETIDTYNRDCQRGYDSLFDKKRKFRPYIILASPVLVISRNTGSSG